MTVDDWAWLAFAAYGLHIMEEYSFNWRDWARAVIGLPVEWADFYVTNAIVIVLGIAQAELASTLVLAPCAFAALMLINATFFHVLPVVRNRGRFSPGLFTAIILFYPVGLGVFVAAHMEERLTIGTGVTAFVIGALIMAYPIVMLRLRSKPYFQQV